MTCRILRVSHVFRGRQRTEERIRRVTPASDMFPTRDPAVAALKKKRVLLVDCSRTKRDLRSDTMRQLGIEVDCAADISEARCWWRADLYDLVLIHVMDAAGPVDRFCNDLRKATPSQQIMFLVGGPAFLSAAPAWERGPEAEDESGALSPRNKTAVALGSGETAEPQTWGIMEACRRISAVRSVCDARTKAIRNRPEPPRDSETSRSGHTFDASTIELIGEESR